jgi:hypothetical protein
MRHSILAGIVLPLSVTPAFAHHSFSAFDMQKSLTLEGTVKEFQWTNPHSWIQLVVADKSGKTIEWSLEMSSTINLVRAGWRPKTVKPGDKVKITIHPHRQTLGRGSVMSAVLANGKTIGILGNAAGKPED